MATVAISQGLVEGVTYNVKQMFARRIKEAEKVPEHWGDMIRSKLYSDETLEKMKALPHDYFGYVGEMTIHGFDRPFRVSFDPQVIRPYNFTYKDNGCEDEWRGLRLDIKNSRWVELTKEVAAWSLNIANLYVERNNAVADVEKVLKTYKTLAPALKAWPALWELLPEGYKERHKRVNERTRIAPVMPDVNLDNLTGELMVKRLTRGNSNA